jgi:hypothetical protein
MERTVEIAGIAVRFHCDRRASALLEARYGAFLRANTPAEAVEVELCLAPRPARPPQSAETFRPVTAGGRIVLTGAGVYAELAPDLSTARLEAPFGERPIDALLRFVIATRLAERDGLLVHASAVTRAGRAWVFAGPSGAGKSTIASTLAGSPLCDEAVALLASGGQVTAHATPYWRAQPGSAPVAGVLFLRRGPAPSWQALSQSAAVRQLIPATGPLLPAWATRALTAAAHVAAACPCAVLTLSQIDDIHTWLPPRLDGDIAAAMPRPC